MAVRLLLTGFEAYGPHAVNPSERAVKLLADAGPEGTVMSTRVLPVSYRNAFDPVRDAFENERFHAVLLLGLGAGRQTLDFERFAVNWRGGPRADNEGLRLDGEGIDPAGPAAYFSTVPLEELVASCRTAGVPASISSNAGTYLCNQVLYQALRYCDLHDLRCRVGFAHLPLLPDQAGEGEPHMHEELIVAGLRAALARLASLPPPVTPGLPEGTGGERA